MDTINVSNVHKTYGHVQALSGLDLNVRRGEIFGLLGANGAGKTTLIKILVGLLRQDSGDVEVMGLNPQRDKQALRQKIGYMPQTPVLYHDLSGRENLRFFGQAHHLPDLKERIDSVLDFVSLTGRQYDPVYGFSGGMKQRLSLACALVHQPELLLLDEPTTGVDPKLRETFWQTFRQMTDEGATIILSTHQMDEALYCDRLAVMRDGQVLICDTPKSLMQRGETVVTIQNGTQSHSETVHDYATALPKLLESYHLDSGISRIEIERATLETIVLDLIEEQTAS